MKWSSPSGYMTKDEVAQRLGCSTKTLDRRRKEDQIFRRVLRKGNQLLFPVEEVEAYFQLCKQRGHI